MVLLGLDQVVSADDGGGRASGMVLCLQESLLALEEFGNWAEALRMVRHQQLDILTALDRARCRWDLFFPKLRAADATSYAELFDLVLPADAPAETRQIHDDALDAWARLARAVAENATRPTQGHERLLYRLLNTIKHGLGVYAGSTAGDNEMLFFHPEGNVRGTRDLPHLAISTASARSLLEDTFTVNRLTSATLRTWYTMHYGEPPDVPPLLEFAARQMSNEEIREGCRLAVLPRFVQAE